MVPGLTTAAQKSGSPLPLPIRVSNGVEVTVSQADSEFSKVTLDSVSALAGINMFGLNLIANRSQTYTGDHGWPLEVGKSWVIDEFTTLDPPMQPDSTVVFEVEVVALESVTVPAGTYDAYKIEYTKVAEDGSALPPELSKTEWFSPEVGRMVKSEDYLGYAEVETQELKSFTP